MSAGKPLTREQRVELLLDLYELCSQPITPGDWDAFEDALAAGYEPARQGWTTDPTTDADWKMTCECVEAELAVAGTVARARRSGNCSSCVVCAGTGVLVGRHIS